MKDENTNNICAIKSKCTGCGFCFAICPVSAVSMTTNDYGFYVPIVDNKCINCGICKKGCNKYFEKQISCCEPIAFSCHSKNTLNTLASSSGGVSNELMQYLIKEGYTIIGCAYINQSAEHIIVKNEKDINLFRGSKYFQSNVSNAMRYIASKPENEKIAFFGLPCQIYAIEKLIEIKKFTRKDFLLVSLMCYGCPSKKLWDKNIEYICEAAREKPIKIDFRSKKYGWHTSTIAYYFNNKTVYSRMPENKFLNLFYSRYLDNDACFDCLHRTNLEIGDLRIGDYWGEKFKNDETGVSCVIVCSKIGLNIFNLISDKLIFKIEDYRDIINAQSFYNLESVDQKLTTTFQKELNNGIIAANKLLFKTMPFRKKIYNYYRLFKNRLYDK